MKVTFVNKPSRSEYESFYWLLLSIFLHLFYPMRTFIYGQNKQHNCLFFVGGTLALKNDLNLLVVKFCWHLNGGLFAFLAAKGVNPVSSNSWWKAETSKSHSSASCLLGGAKPKLLQVQPSADMFELWSIHFCCSYLMGASEVGSGQAGWRCEVQSVLFSCFCVMAL